jgi:hypothetical protein
MKNFEKDDMKENDLEGWPSAVWCCSTRLSPCMVAALSLS